MSKQEITALLNNKGIDQLELKEHIWLQRFYRGFYFISDGAMDFKELNLKLEGNENTAFSLRNGFAERFYQFKVNMCTLSKQRTKFCSF